MGSKTVDHLLVDDGFKLPGKEILLACILGKVHHRHKEDHVCIVSEKEGREVGTEGGSGRKEEEGR